MATSIDFPCSRCGAKVGEPCWTLTNGAMRKAPHDDRRRKAGERVERPEPTARQVEAREAGWRYFVVAGALGTLRNMLQCRPNSIFGDEDMRDVAAAVEALGRVNDRRKARALDRQLERVERASGAYLSGGFRG